MGSIESEELQGKRHSLAHLLATSVIQLYPGAQNAIGPSIENGFYQDFDIPVNISDEELPKIEAKMREVLTTWKTSSRKEVTVEEAKKEFAWNKYKSELIDDFAKNDKHITFYTLGDFVDLCKGGHTEDATTIDPQAFKLTKVAGAYWRGDSNNKMLTRIYGLAFNTKQELEDYVAMQEEAEKRDHRKLGIPLDLFTFSDLVGKGLPLWTPKGTLLRELLNNYSQQLRINKGWQRVWSPHITKNDLYKTSGHWAKFGDELFLVKSQETSDELVMKPMNCPHHQQIYASRPHSYRELPIRYMETTTVYRDEKAGELMGLSRVRSITQDDSHTFCTPDQIEEIYQQLIDVTKEFYATIGMKLRARLSFRDPAEPDKYLGEPELWQKAQDTLLSIAKKNELDYFIGEGEAAFYGPKIDFMAQDAIGREHQLATPQLDFVQPKRFGLVYTDAEGKEQTPVMIHFALMGSIERFLSVYIEHTAGVFPLWVAPVQVSILPISDNQLEYARKVKSEIETALPDARVEVDERSESVGKKIREASKSKVPYMAIVGEKEVQAGTVSIRGRNDADLGAMSTHDFTQKLQTEVKSKQ